MKTNFTKGKWYISEELNNPDSVYKEKGARSVRNDEWFICEVLGNAGGGNVLFNEDTPTEESKANAKLIAAAPDLLDALQKMVNACLSESPEMDKVKALRIAKSTIKKATE